MQFFVSIIFAIIIWFAVRYIVQLKPSQIRSRAESLSNKSNNINGRASTKIRTRNRRRKAYTNTKLISDFLRPGGEAQKTTMPWKTFLTEYGNQELKNIINFEEFSSKQTKLFENIFEIIKTEHSYLQQLDQLVSASKDATLSSLISDYDRRLLFGKIAIIHRHNEQLFCEFCDHFDSDCSMLGLFDILKHFLLDKAVRDCYVEYNRFHEERNQLVLRLAERPETAKLPVSLQSLTIVPVQRITRYPLLLQSIISHLPKYDSEAEPVDKLDSILGQFDRETIETTQLAAMDFAECCNRTLDSEIKLLNLAKLKNQLDDKITAVKEFVKTGREIVLETTLKLYRVKIHDGIGSAIHNSLNSVIKNHTVRLVLLTDMLLFLMEGSKKRRWRIYAQGLLTSMEVSFPKSDQQFPPKNGSNSEKRISGEVKGESSSTKKDFVGGPPSPMTPTSPKTNSKFFAQSSTSLISELDEKAAENSNESSEKESQDDSQGSSGWKVPRMRISFGPGKDHFALLFPTEEEEDAFVMAFHRQRNLQFNL